MSQADDVTYTDADLVALLRAGDEEAIAQIVEQWSPTMFRVARSFVDSPQSAEDVVQEAWLGMLSGLARFEGRSSLRTWMFTILVNRARSRGAREARTVPQPPLASRGEANADDWFPGPGGEAARIWSSIDAAVPVGHHPGKRSAVQGNPAPARPGGVGAAATAAPGGDHA